MINNYDDFCAELIKCGFSLGSSNDEGVFSLSSRFSDKIAWHTENPETDPWEWRMRVLDERNDIAYAKLFFKKSGFITRELYPYFYSARRNGKTLEREYSAGKISRMANTVYDIIENKGVVSAHALRSLADIGKEDTPRFEKALCDLQMKMYITICGRQHKISLKGDEYGWYSTVFCLTESFFGFEAVEQAEKIAPEEATDFILKRIYELNPAADAKKAAKFITG